MLRSIIAGFALFSFFMLSAVPVMAHPSGLDTPGSMPFLEQGVYGISDTDVQVVLYAWKEDKTGEVVMTIQIGGLDGTAEVSIAEIRFKSEKEYADNKPYEIWIDSCLMRGEPLCEKVELFSSTELAKMADIVARYFQELQKQKTGKPN